MSDNLSKNILSTVVYYDCMDYPLTAFEIWKYLISCRPQSATREPQSGSLADIIGELEKNSLKKFIEEYNGFYFLGGRKELVGKRLARNKISNAKIKKLRKVIRFLRFIPFVRMVGITGRLSMKNAEAASDWDVLVVLKKGRIFIGRALVSLSAHIIGKRRHGKKISNRVCLNYFITDKSLEIGMKDIFSSSEYFFMIPVFGFEIFSEFKAKNSWIKKYRPNFREEDAADLKLIKDGFFPKIFREVGEKMLNFDFFEKKLKKWQVGRIERDPRTNLAGSAVMANDEALVFLPDPQGPKIFEKFYERLDGLTKV